MSTAQEALAAASESWNAGDLNGYLSLYDEGIALHGYSPEPMGKEQVRGFYEAIFTAFGSSKLEFHEVLVDGDLYCCRFTMSGVQGGEFMGAPASGRPYSLEGITIMRFDGEQVVERWSTADFLGMLTQIGAIPAPV